MRSDQNVKLFGNGCRHQFKFILHLPKNWNLFLTPPPQVERGVKKVGERYQERIVVRQAALKTGALARAGLQKIVQQGQLLAKRLMYLFYLRFRPMQLLAMN
jgi:hypothetical protein